MSKSNGKTYDETQNKGQNRKKKQQDIEIRSTLKMIMLFQIISQERHKQPCSKMYISKEKHIKGYNK